jgi:hypothetical protein
VSDVNPRLSGRVQRVFAALLLLLAGLTIGHAAENGIASAHAAAEDPPAALERLPLPGEELDVALLTVGPGQVYWQRFGHNAILIRDRNAGLDRLYNFGMFDFAAEDFFLEFARGRMTYLLVAGDVETDLRGYLAEGREVSLQWLDLDPAARLALRDALEDNARPENAAYRYDYFRDNCSTRVRDALDQATGGALKRATDRRSRGFTHRMHAQRLTEADLPLYLGIHAALGPATDAPISFWDEMFIPMVLRDEIAGVELEGPDGTRRPLVISSQQLAEARFQQPAGAPRIWFWRFFGVGMALAGVLLWLGSPAAMGTRLRVFGALSGLLWMLSGVGGLVLAFLAFASEHQAAWRNENLALFNPLALLLLPIAWSALRGLRLSSVLWPGVAGAIVLSGFTVWLAKVMPGFRQDNMDWVALWLPIHAALLWSVLQGRHRMRLPGATAG